MLEELLVHAQLAALLGYQGKGHGEVVVHEVQDADLVQVRLGYVRLQRPGHEVFVFLDDVYRLVRDHADVGEVQPDVVPCKFLRYRRAGHGLDLGHQQRDVVQLAYGDLPLNNGVGLGADDETEEPAEGAKKNKVVNIHATTQLKVVLVKPERFEDASTIADHLNNKRTVVLNLASTNKEVSRRLVDFLSGVAYANNGQIKRVANSTFIITPYNVDIMGDLLDELENNGAFY